MFTRSNPYHGKCERCDYEICIRCGLPYHKQKSCKAQLDDAMNEFFDGEDKKNLSNCPRCGILILKSERDGCNHMKCSTCSYEFCWICGMKYTVNHFDKSNVFGCQGLQESEPQSRCKLLSITILHTIMVPFTLLFYPVYVVFAAMRNPYYMPKEYRCLCFCSDLLENCNLIVSCFLACFFIPLALVIGLVLGAFNCAIFVVPALLLKLYKLLLMIVVWRCSWCLKRHKN